MDGYTIVLADDDSEADRAIVEQGLTAFNRSHAEYEGWRRLNLFVRDGEGRIVGGLLGYKEWNWLYIAIFWLEESLRGRGIGSKVLRRAEAEAVVLGCDSVRLDTYGFQAPGFYEKLGYTVFGELADYPPGYTFYFMCKRDLTAAKR